MSARRLFVKKSPQAICSLRRRFGGEGGIRPAPRSRPGRGSGVPPARHSLPLPFESPMQKNERPCGAPVFLAEKVGFEPTCPCGQLDFGSSSLRPLRYFSVFSFSKARKSTEKIWAVSAKRCRFFERPKNKALKKPYFRPFPGA